MRYKPLSLLAFVCGLFAILMPSQSIASQIGDVRLTFADYTLSARDQINLQEIAGEFTIAASPTLNLLLKAIDVRTALEDTERLHNDKG